MPKLRLLPPVVAADRPEQAVPIIEYLMRRGGTIAIDTETTGLDLMRSRVLYWSMATEDRRFFFPYELLGFFAPLFAREDITWFLANAKYDMHMLSNMGYQLKGNTWDIVVMDAMDDDTRPHGLKEQAWHAYEAKWGEFKQLFIDPRFVADTLGLDKASYASFRKMALGDKLNFVYNEQPHLVVDYATCDAYFTFIRALDLRDRLAATPLPTSIVPELKNSLNYFETIEVPLTRALWSMERTGFAVDMDYVKAIDTPLREGIRKHEMEVIKEAGTKINPRSNDDLRELLFSKTGFGLKPIKNTASKGKKPSAVASVDDKVLEKLLSRVQPNSQPARFLLALRAYRKLLKAHSTYVKKIPTHLGPDGRVHCSLNQTGARTSRLSSSNPNMQNIPTRNDPYKIRGMFVAEEGEELLDLDYPQIEFRIAAALAGEKGMMESIRKGWDIHSANAAAMYKKENILYEHVTEARRKKDAKEKLTDYDRLCLRRRDGAKTVGLGTLYGEGPRKMAVELGIDVDEAIDLRNRFFDTNPNIENLIQYMHAYAHEHERTYTMLGRMRQLYRINSDMGGLVSSEERQAFNCLDEETEALTTRGWVKGFDLRRDDILLTKNADTNKLEWQPLTDLRLFGNYEGELIEFRSGAFNAVSTPNHRWLVTNKATGRNECKVTESISIHGDHRIHRTGLYAGVENSELDDDYVELLGWACTDGSFKGKTGVTLYQSETANPENVRRIDALLSRLKIQHHRRVYNGVARWEINRDEGGRLQSYLPERHLSVDLLLRLSSVQLELLFQTVVRADGWTTNNQTTICARDRAQAEALQVLCVLTSRCANVRCRDLRRYGTRFSPKVQASGITPTKPIWLVSVLRRDKAQIVSSQKRTYSVSGAKIWCPVVPNTYFVARREGQVFITGNTLVQGSGAEMMKLAILRVHYNKDFASLGGKLILTVHDELIGKAPKSTAKDCFEIMKELMSDPYNWGPINLKYPVPVDPDGSTGHRWSELK